MLATALLPSGFGPRYAERARPPRPSRVLPRVYGYLCGWKASKSSVQPSQTFAGTDSLHAVNVQRAPEGLSTTTSHCFFLNVPMCLSKSSCAQPLSKGNT